MRLRVKTQQVIDCMEWDKLVRETYGKPYCFQQQDGCKSRGNEYITVPDEPEDYSNDTVPEEINGGDMGVSFSAWLTRDPNEWNGYKADERFLDLFWQRNFYPHVSMIANDLHQKGLLDAGDYTINIDW